MESKALVGSALTCAAGASAAKPKRERNIRVALIFLQLY